MTEIDPEQRHPVRPRQFGAAQQAAVAPEYQDEFGAVGGVIICLDDLASTRGRAHRLHRRAPVGRRSPR